MKLIKEEHSTGQVTYKFPCPGCGHDHAYFIPQWSFNNDLDKPSFTPSLLNTITPSVESGRPKRICHLYVTDGMIHYCADCTHALQGKIIEMSVISE